MSDQRIAILRIRTRAFRFPKGQSGTPNGQSRFYHERRKIAREASPQMMRGLIELAKTAEDERVRSVCLMAVPDRAGVKPIEFPEMLEEIRANEKWLPLDVRAYPREEQELMRQAITFNSREPAVADIAGRDRSARSAVGW